MEKSLKEVNGKFYKKLKESSTDEEKMEKFENYFKWINDKVEANVDGADYYYWMVLSEAVKLIKKSSLKAKDISRKWNGALVASTFEFCKWYREFKYTRPTEYNAKFGVLMKSILDEADFGTILYCLQILQDDKVVNLAETANYTKEANAKEVIVAETTVA